MVKEEIMNKRSQNVEMVSHLQDTLKNEQGAKKSAELNVRILKQKLEEKLGLIEKIKNSSNRQVGKDFLASEKLAFTKKKKSVSPLKPKENSTPKLLSKRVKSLTKRIKRIL